MFLLIFEIVFNFNPPYSPFSSADLVRDCGVAHSPTSWGTFPTLVVIFPTLVATFPTLVGKPPTPVRTLPTLVATLPTH